MTVEKPPPEGSSRTVVLDGNRVRIARKERGWSQKKFAEETDKVTRELARLEDEENDRGLVYYHVRDRNRRLDMAGLSVSTISGIEREKEIFLFTAFIVSATLNIPLKDLILSPPPNRKPPKPSPGDDLRPGL